MIMVEFGPVLHKEKPSKNIYIGLGPITGRKPKSKYWHSSKGKGLLFGSKRSRKSKVRRVT